MSRASLLQETALWMDTVNLALCLFIYEVCNDCQFEFASGSDFVNFMNLKPTSRPVTVRPKENLRVCYMVFSVYNPQIQIFAETEMKRPFFERSTKTKRPKKDLRTTQTTKPEIRAKITLFRALSSTIQQAI